MLEMINSDTYAFIFSIVNILASNVYVLTCLRLSNVYVLTCLRLSIHATVVNAQALHLCTQLIACIFT